MNVWTLPREMMDPSDPWIVLLDMLNPVISLSPWEAGACQDKVTAPFDGEAVRS